MRLKDKVAVITGGNSGIGLAIAKEFYREGAKVVITGRNAEGLAAAAAEIGEGVVTVQGDVSKLAEIDRIYEASASLGKVDVLVVNAGVAPLTALEHVTEEQFDFIADINFKGAYFTVAKAVPHLNKNASVILIGSGVDVKGFANFSVYAATKAAIRSLARSFSADLLPLNGTRVNVLSPGPIETPIFSKMGMTEAQMQEMGQGMEQMTPMKRFGKPEEMARAALFLASDDSSYMAGSALVADGGISQM